MNCDYCGEVDDHAGCCPSGMTNCPHWPRRVGVQACRPEDRAMLATPAGAQMVAAVAAAMNSEPPNAEVTGLGRNRSNDD